MDSFESIVAALLQRRGYWTQTSLKVRLSKAEKRAIGKSTTPRWELDVVAYKGRTNELLVLECKSLLDSSGVQTATFAGENEGDEARFKMFFEPRTRRVVLKVLTRQLVSQGFCRHNPTVRLGLAAGKVKGDAEWLKRHFERKGWELWSPERLRAGLVEMRDEGYENSVAAVVSKLLLREPASKRRRRPAIEADV